MSTRIYVVDTSYLIELCGCGRDSIPAVAKEVRALMKARSSGRFFVPLPCVFELGNHIADVGHQETRTKLVNWLVAAVRRSLEESRPWTLTPTGQSYEVLPQLMSLFEDVGPKMQIGLTDVFTVEEARRLKARFTQHKARVHIWTNDLNLKKMEPDAEPASLLWKGDGTIFSAY